MANVKKLQDKKSWSNLQDLFVNSNIHSLISFEEYVELQFQKVGHKSKDLFVS